MEVTIKGRTYRIKYTIRALFIYEQITGRPFQMNSLLDNYIFFYSLILANNSTDPLMWDEFIDAIDEDATLLNQLAKIVEDYQRKESIFGTDDATEGEKKS